MTGSNGTQEFLCAKQENSSPEFSMQLLSNFNILAGGTLGSPIFFEKVLAFSPTLILQIAAYPLL